MTRRGVLLFMFLLPFAGMSWIGFGAAQDHLGQHRFMTLQEVQKRWSQKRFSPEVFKSTSTKERASMAYDLIRSKAMIGKTAAEVRSMLGQTSGYFWSDQIPTYFIEEGWKQKQDSWQLVFLTEI
jgi:hypothetical protein